MLRGRDVVNADSPRGAARDVGFTVVAVGQGVYYVLTGLWPLVKMRSFEAITGPKVDRWLAQTVGWLVTVVGGVLIMAGVRQQARQEAAVLGVGSAVGLAGHRGSFGGAWADLAGVPARCSAGDWAGGRLGLRVEMDQAPFSPSSLLVFSNALGPGLHDTCLAPRPGAERRPGVPGPIPVSVNLAGCPRGVRCVSLDLVELRCQ